LVVEAMRKLGNGDAAGASEDLLAVHRLGRLIGRGPTLIARLVSLIFDAGATRGSEALMQSPGIKPGVLRKHLAALGKLPAIPSMADAIDKSERFSALDSVQVVIREGFVLGKTLNVIQGQGVDKAAGKGRGIPWWMIDFDVMLKRVNDEYDRVVKLAQAKSGEELKRLGREHTRHLVVEMKSYSEEQIWRQKVALALLPNKIRARRIGELLSDVIVNLQLPSVTRAVEMQRQQEAEVDLVRVSLALRLYQADTGKLPEKLSALAPKYVKKVPRDWFGATGKLVYRASESGKGFVVYSVGMNGSDDGGFGEDGLTPPVDDDDVDDIAVWYRYGEQDSDE
jgi:hypothetical protein